MNWTSATRAHSRRSALTMTDVRAAPAWSLLLLPVVLLSIAYVTAVTDSALQAHWEGRSGASVVGLPARAAVRLLVKQRVRTLAPDALLWRLGTAGVPVIALLASLVIPLGAWTVADLPAGVIWWQGLIAMLWVLLHMAGYSANSTMPMVGAYRFLAQAMAYEMPMAISVICAALAAHSLRVGDIVAGQHGLIYAVWMPAAFAIFLVCAMAAAFYGPFATPTGPDLAGGILADISGVERLLLLAGRYLTLVSTAGFAAAIYLGGGAGPLLPGAVWSLLKTLAVLGLMVSARWRWPLVRMERFEEFSWIVLLPAAIVQAFVVSLVVL